MTTTARDDGTPAMVRALPLPIGAEPMSTPAFTLSPVELACGVTLDAVQDARARGLLALDGTGTRFTAPADVSPAVAGAAARMAFGERGEFVGMDGTGCPVYRVNGVHPLLSDAAPTPERTPEQSAALARVMGDAATVAEQQQSTPAPTFERVNTHALATGDTVHHYGMVILLGERGERFDPSTGRTVVWFAGTVLNSNDVDLARLVPVSWRTAPGYAPGTYWLIQGNDLAHWVRQTA